MTLKCGKCKEEFKDNHVSILTCPICSSTNIYPINSKKEA